MSGSPASDRTAPAHRVGDRYVLRGEIGRGGMACVHRALDVVLEREVAIKLPHAHLASDASFLDRFRREARAAAALAHPNVVAVHDWGQDEDGGAYLVLQLVEGPSLRALLRWAGRLDPATTAAVLLPAAEGLGAAHAAGFVHRDVKPENLLLGRDGTVRVTDFGLARAAASATSTFGADVLMGSPHYLAPEAVQGERLDPRADVYALGIVLFECLTGRPPHEAESAYATAVAHTWRPVPPPSEVLPGVDARLDDLVLAATAIDRADRPDDASLFASELATLMPEGSRIDLAALVDEISGPPPPPRRSTGTLALPIENVTTTITHGSGRARPSEDDPSASEHITATTARAGSDRPADPDVGPLGGTDEGSDERAAAEVGGDLPLPAIGPEQDIPGRSEDPADADAPDHHDSGSTALPRRRRRSVVALLVLALLAGSAAGGYLLWDRVLAPLAAIPSVAGLAADDAVAQLEAAGFEAAVAEEAPFDLDVPAGHVLSQDPVGEARRSTPVRLVLSAGPRPVEVPSVVGLPQAAARETLEDAGLLSAVVEEHDADAPAGEVTAVRPQPGAVVDEGSTVELTVSLGPPPIEVPELLGGSADTARETVAALGLELEVVERRHDDQQPVGAVLEQSPEPGATLFDGDVVEIVVSDGPPPVEVPGVRGLLLGEGVTLLEDAGFAVEIELRGGFGAFLNPGRIFDQDPGPGAIRHRGATVTVYAYED